MDGFRLIRKDVDKLGRAPIGGIQDIQRAPVRPGPQLAAKILTSLEVERKVNRPKRRLQNGPGEQSTFSNSQKHTK